MGGLAVLAQSEAGVRQRKAIFDLQSLSWCTHEQSLSSHLQWASKVVLLWACSQIDVLPRADTRPPGTASPTIASRGRSPGGLRPVA